MAGLKEDIARGWGRKLTNVIGIKRHIHLSGIQIRRTGSKYGKTFMVQCNTPHAKYTWLYAGNGLPVLVCISSSTICRSMSFFQKYPLHSLFR
jgi:hypothetical protein